MCGLHEWSSHNDWSCGIEDACTMGTSKVSNRSAFSACGNTVVPKLCAHVTKGIRTYIQNTVSVGLKLRSDEKNSSDCDTDNCAQGWATKCYLIFNTRKCFGWWNSCKKVCGCFTCRMLSQNQLWNDGYGDSRRDKRVGVTNLKSVDHFLLISGENRSTMQNFSSTSRMNSEVAKSI